jgi:hypothetical protein
VSGIRRFRSFTVEVVWPGVAVWDLIFLPGGISPGNAKLVLSTKNGASSFDSPEQHVHLARALTGGQQMVPARNSWNRVNHELDLDEIDQGGPQLKNFGRPCR